jgi:hypothetical protein
MNMYRGVEVPLQAFLTSGLGGGEWSASRAACFTPREAALGTHYMKGSAGPRAGLFAIEKRKVSRPWKESNPNSSVVHTSLCSLYSLFKEKRVLQVERNLKWKPDGLIQ